MEVCEVSMLTRFNEAMIEPELKGIVEIIKDVWLSMGSPEPESGCTTGCRGNRYITEYSYEYQEPVVDRCNHLIDLLWILVDEYHIGSGIWYTHYYRSDNWNSYYDGVVEIIDEFIRDCLWELVCNECD